MEPTVWLAFAYGFCGSMAVEIILILQSMGPKGAVAGKYKTRLFWGVRLSLGLISGLIATRLLRPLSCPLFLYIHLGAGHASDPDTSLPNRRARFRPI